jgi:hypothetical protein
MRDDALDGGPAEVAGRPLNDAQHEELLTERD